MTLCSATTSGAAALLALAFCADCLADTASFDVSGHTKANLLGDLYPDNSVYRQLLGSSASELQGELRLNIDWRDDGWSAAASYQLIGLLSEALSVASGAPPALDGLGRLVPNDRRRLMNLTTTIDESSDAVLLQRLDRLWVGYTTEKAVVRVGRQALTWGNGLYYAPMDLVNPFDPSAIDTEYKPGDDMLYGQYLCANGADIQGAVVFRRDLQNGDVQSNQLTTALKYHGFSKEYEFDLLLAKNYGDPVIGAGISRDLGGSLLGVDVVLTDAKDSTYLELAANLSYSWVFRGRNMSGALEYYFNGFGLAGDVSVARVAADPVLADRLARGQQFTVGRHYLGGSVTVEMTPLWTLTPVLLANIEDPSALLQLTSSLSLSDDLALLGNINVPLGADGSEYGGIAVPAVGGYLATSVGIFAQIAWYF